MSNRRGGNYDKVASILQRISVRDDQIVCLEGNGSRPSHMGDGWMIGGAMYTLNGTEVHAVCYDPVLVLNDQGGGIMNISYDVVHTLRAQTKHHEPIISNRLSYGLEPGAATKMNWENRIHKELTPTLRQNMGDNQISVIVLENRKNDRLQKNGSPDPQGRVSRMGRNGSV